METTIDMAARQRGGLRAFLRLFVDATPGARLLDTPRGVTALICPTRPERSLVNSVVYDDPAALVAALPALACDYDAEGIEAWTVWANVGDEIVPEACAAHRHVLDATPELMWAPLDTLSPDVELADDVTLDRDASWGALGDLCDAANGLPADHLACTIRAADPVAGLRTVAVEGRRPVACAAAVIDDDNAHVILVATLPDRRGHGLASRCTADVLARARAAGAETTTLEATQLGRPVYRRMGYRELGALGMWERRRR